MRKFDYHIERDVDPYSDTPTLISLGEQGWELVTVHRGCYVFKRDKREDQHEKQQQFLTEEQGEDAHVSH